MILNKIGFEDQGLLSYELKFIDIFYFFLVVFACLLVLNINIVFYGFILGKRLGLVFDWFQVYPPVKICSSLLLLQPEGACKIP